MDANTPSDSPIARRKLSHEVLARLLERVRGGAYPVGSLLPSERELMLAFGVGRPAVREALQAMERMGLLTIVHGEGARVRALSADSVIAQISESAVHLLTAEPGLLDHLKEARMAFEVAMARQAAQRATPADIDVLRARLAANRDALGDPARFLETDLALHRAIAQISGNPVYVAVSRAMLDWLERFHREMVRAPGAEQVTCEEHARLVDRIAAGDAPGAERAVIEHLLRANAMYRSAATAPALPGPKRRARRAAPPRNA